MSYTGDIQLLQTAICIWLLLCEPSFTASNTPALGKDLHQNSTLKGQLLLTQTHSRLTGSKHLQLLAGYKGQPAGDKKPTAMQLKPLPQSLALFNVCILPLFCSNPLIPIC